MLIVDVEHKQPLSSIYAAATAPSDFFAIQADKHSSLVAV